MPGLLKSWIIIEELSMSIRIEDLNTMDFSDVVDSTANDLPPIHPGEILREDFLAPLGLSVDALALALHVPAIHLYEIIKERRAITPDTALRLACYFGGDARSWLNLQAEFDLKQAIQTQGERIRREVQPRIAA